MSKFASFKEPVSFNDHGKQISGSKGLAKIYGYMGLGLLITMAVCLGAGLVLRNFILNGATKQTANNVYIGLLIGSFIVLLIDSFTLGLIGAKGKSIMIPYIIYTICMGIFLAGFLVTGVSLSTLAISFGITSVVFLILFCIGWFSKVNLNPLGFAVAGILSVVCLSFLIFSIFYFINPSSFANAYPVFYIVLSIALGVFVIVITAVDSYNIRKIIDKGGENNKNMLLYCAFTMYVDFIMILIRVIMIVASIRKN